MNRIANWVWWCYECHRGWRPDQAPGGYCPVRRCGRRLTREFLVTQEKREEVYA